MRIVQKPLSLLLAVIIILSVVVAFPVSANAQEAPLIKGTFTVMTFDGYDPGELAYYYSDSYFSGSGKALDPHLRTMSAALVFSCQGTSASPEQTYGRILRHIGFKDIETYDMDHTAMDSTGMVLARKMIGGKEVVAVALRGDEYELEMASNFIAGAQGDILTFAEAEARVESRVRAYIERYGIAQAKYWVVGYSRSGAVANLFGRELNRDLSGFCTTGDDVYVYTFEAAIASADSTVYENIHNIVDRRDLITYVYPAAWSLYGCGVPDVIGDTDETITLRSLSLYSDSHIEELGQIDSSAFIQDFIGFLGTNLSRETFCEKLQTPLTQVLEIYFSLSEEQREGFVAYYRQVFSELMNDDRLISKLVGALIDPKSEASAKSLANLLIKYMDQVAAESGKPVSDEAYETLKAAVLPTVRGILPVVAKDFDASYDPGDGSAATPAPMYHIMTLVGNLSALFRHHFNYNVFAELTALDTYYQKGEEVILGDADGDGDVSIADSTVIQRVLAGFPVDSYFEQAADADEDQEITIMDVTMIQRFLAMMPASENIGKPIA